MAQKADRDEGSGLPLSSIVAANVYARRVLRIPKMSQGALAAAAGLDVDTIGRIEAGRDPAKRQMRIRLDTIERLAEALGCEPLDLLRFDSTTRVYLNRSFQVIPGQGKGGRRDVPLAAVVR